MGLDLTIYKENKKGKREELAYFASDGWPIVKYFETLFDKPLNDIDTPISVEQIREFLTYCKEVLLAYYNRTFDNPKEWIKVAYNIIPNDVGNEYDYIDCISEIYDELWKVQEELYDNENVILDISY